MVCDFDEMPFHFSETLGEEFVVFQLEGSEVFLRLDGFENFCELGVIDAAVF